MANKPTRTEHELEALIMQEVRRHPEFSRIQGIAITRPSQLAPHFPNWGFGWVTDGAGIRPTAADAIAERLQREFDLA